MQVGELHVEALQTAENIRTGALQEFGGLGQVEFFADVIEQRLADQFFKLANLQAHGRLGQGHFLSRAAVGQVTAHRAEHLYLSKCHTQQ